MPEVESPLLVGDEVSSACTGIRADLELAYDLYTRKRYEEARELFKLIGDRAHCAGNALQIEQLASRGNQTLARILRRSCRVRPEG